MHRVTDRQDDIMITNGINSNELPIFIIVLPIPIPIPILI